jgi:DNA replication protein DnaC
MLNEQTIAILNSLKLFGMAGGLSERLTDPGHGGLSHADFIGLLVQDEKTYRDNKRLARLLRNARLRQPASLEDIDYAHARGLSKQVMLELTNTQWITAHRNALVTGPTGIGKSFIACALGNAAARAGNNGWSETTLEAHAQAVKTINERFSGRLALSPTHREMSGFSIRVSNHTSQKRDRP